MDMIPEELASENDAFSQVTIEHIKFTLSLNFAQDYFANILFSNCKSQQF
jgi:hypothetical protein